MDFHALGGGQKRDFYLVYTSRARQSLIPMGIASLYILLHVPLVTVLPLVTPTHASSVTNHEDLAVSWLHSPNNCPA